MSKHTNLALRSNSKLLIMSLMSSSDTLGVPTSPMYKMLLSEIIILVLLGSDSLGADFTDNFSERDLFLCLTGMFSRLMTKKVSEPATRCFLGIYLPLPTP